MKNSILLILLFVAISCKQNKNNEFENKINRLSFENFLNDHNLKMESFKKIVIIPNAGCDGCISEAEQKFVDRYESLDTLYVFTRIADLKIFRNTLPKNALMSKNVLIDTNGLINSYGFHSMYPSFIEDVSEKTLTAVPYQ